MGASKRYSELLEVYEGLRGGRARRHRRLGCPVIDVSDQSIEETATRVVRLVHDRAEAAAVG